MENRDAMFSGSLYIHRDGIAAGTPDRRQLGTGLNDPPGDRRQVSEQNIHIANAVNQSLGITFEFFHGRVIDLWPQAACSPRPPGAQFPPHR
jgi:hypothetical protein